MSEEPDNHPQIAPPPPVFREFLYADLDRVRSLVAQLSGGVPEEARGTSSMSRRFNIGAANYLGYNNDRRTEEYIQRSLLDALFPDLEAILDSEGWLTDVSDIVHGDGDESRLLSLVAEGSIIRMSADAQLFDAEYVARVLAGFGTAVNGITTIGGIPAPSPTGGPTGQKKGGKKPPRPSDAPTFTETGRLEDLIEPFHPGLLEGVTTELLKGFVQTSRGMFQKGLHVLVSTRGEVGWTATARLQEGRHYLDAEPEILFSRYGTTPQEWTIVGTVGRFSEEVPDASALDGMNFVDEANGRISRTALVAGLNTFMAYLAGQGLADSPPHPGFSIVPIAVYRTIPPRRHSD